MTVRLAQITDVHAGAAWGSRDPLDTLAEVIAAIHALPQPPDAVLVTGDLVNDGRLAQYAALEPVLGQLGLPFWVLPGNHDDRSALRRHLGVGVGGDGEGRDPIQYVVWSDPLRVVMLDTTIPGQPGGDLDAARLQWLSQVLEADPEHLTLLAMHHPPFPCGVREMDRIGLASGAGAAFAELLDDHPQVVGVIAGHHHRTIVGCVAGRPAIVAPSTYGQLPLDFDADRLAIVADPIGFVVHTLVDGAFVSHVQTLTSTASG